MKKLSDYLDQNEFLKAIFDAAPLGMMVVDADRRVQAVNNYMRQTFGVSGVTVIDSSMGKIIQCLDEMVMPGLCGNGEQCQKCTLMNSALASLKGKKIFRNKFEVQLKAGNSVSLPQKTLLVTATPIEYGNEKMSLVILEDITELVVLRQQIKKLDSLDSFIGNDPKIIQLRGKIKVLADVDMPVFIEGESGTGKELIAVAIHKQGTRASKPFVPVNCGALPEALLESELFGHVKGAFTGAMRDKKGRFEMADGGTIFLDEVGDISPAMQVKLLRVLQESTFEPVGGEKTIKVNVRIISATNKDIKKEIEQRRFREDLYYRLCVIPLTIPPLRQRKEDIVILAAHILKESMLSINKAAAKFSPEAIDSLLNYLWPGNVRELQNAIQYALVNCRNNIILPADFPPSITNFHLQNQTQQKRTRRKKLNAYDVKNVLIETKGNKVDAAKKLGVGRATLYRFLEAEEFG